MRGDSDQLGSFDRELAFLSAEFVRIPGDAVDASILSGLERCGWTVNGAGNAAEQLGIHPSTLRGRMKRLRINRPR